MRFYGSAMRTPHVHGAFRTVLLCDAEQCARIADGVSLSLAALAEPFSVGLHAVARAGSLEGKSVLVSGCGPIGALGARRRASAQPGRNRRHRCRRRTAGRGPRPRRSLAINVASDREWVRRYAAGKGSFDVMIECSGSERALREGLEVMRPRGTVVQLGLGGDVSVPQNLIVTKELSIRGSFRFHAEFAEAVGLINDGRVDLAPVITPLVPDDAGATGVRAGRRPHAGDEGADRFRVG